MTDPGCRKIRPYADGKAYAAVSQCTYRVPHWEREGKYELRTARSSFAGRYRVRMDTSVFREPGCGMGSVLRTLGCIAEAVEGGVLPEQFSWARVNVIHPQRLFVEGIFDPGSPLSTLRSQMSSARREDLERLTNTLPLCFVDCDPADPEIFLTYPVMLYPEELLKMFLQRQFPLPQEELDFLRPPIRDAVMAEAGERPRLAFIGGTSGLEPGQLMLMEAARREGIETRQFLPGQHQRSESGVLWATFDLEAIRAFRPHFVGLSTISSREDAMRVCLSLFRQEFPDTVVLVGGPLVTNLPKVAVTSFVGANVFVRGQAEWLLPRLLRAWGTGGREGPFSAAQREVLADLPGTVAILPDEILVTDLDHANYVTEEGYVLPSAELFDSGAAEWHADDFLIFSRFCTRPVCRYCMIPPGQYVTAPLDEALRQIKFNLSRAPAGQIPTIGIGDDDALGRPQFYRDLQARLEAEGLLGKVAFAFEQVSMRSFVKAGRVDCELIGLLQKLGLNLVHFGMDGAYPGALDAYNKMPKFADCMRVLFEFRRRGIKVDVNWIALPPRATRQDLARVLFHRAIFKLLDIEFGYINPTVGPGQGTPFGDLWVEECPEAILARRAELAKRFECPDFMASDCLLWVPDMVGELFLLDPATKALLVRDKQMLFAVGRGTSKEGVVALDIRIDPLAYMLVALPEEMLAVISDKEPFYRVKLALLWLTMNFDDYPSFADFPDQSADEQRRIFRKRIKKLLRQPAFSRVNTALRRLNEAEVAKILSPEGIEAAL